MFKAPKIYFPTSPTHFSPLKSGQPLYSGHWSQCVLYREVPLYILYICMYFYSKVYQHYSDIDQVPPSDFLRIPQFLGEYIFTYTSAWSTVQCSLIVVHASSVIFVYSMDVVWTNIFNVCIYVFTSACVCVSV